MLITCSMRVNAPAEVVFACVDEPDKIVQWVEGALEHAYTTPRDPLRVVGQRFRQKLQQGPKVQEYQGEIIAWERPTHFGIRIPAPSYSSEAHFRIKPIDAASCQVDYGIDVTLLTPLAKVIGTLLRLPIGLFVRKQIGRLKRCAEGMVAGGRVAA